MQNLAVALLPLLTVGLYFVAARIWFLGQVEILVALPLSGCFLTASKVVKNECSPWWLGALFGICAATVAVFKLLLTIIPIAVGLSVIALTHNGKSGNWRSRNARFVLPAILGFFGILGLVSLHFLLLGSWRAFWWTQFCYPLLALFELEGRSVGQLAKNMQWILIAFAPAAPVLIRVVKEKRVAPLRVDEIIAIVWVIVGFGAILVQKNSWLAYHFLLLLLPAGYLVCSAINRFLGTRPSRHGGRIVVMTVLAIFMVAGMKQVPSRVHAISASWNAPQGHALAHFRDALKPGYLETQGMIKEIQREADPCQTMAALGDPEAVLLAELVPALSINGTTVEHLLPEQQRWYIREFVEQKPDYVFLEYGRGDGKDAIFTALLPFLRVNYQVKLRGQRGLWFERIR